MYYLVQLEVTLNSLLGWLTETWTQQWPIFNEMEMPELPCCNVEERIPRLREIGILELIYHV